MKTIEQAKPHSDPIDTLPPAKMQLDRPDSPLASLFTIEFWGVRGQIPTPGINTVRYGGNTACLEMCLAGKRLIFDGGTGLRLLGNNLLKSSLVEAHLFFTNCQWDRIQGFPFFIPAFNPVNSFYIYGADRADGLSFQECLTSQMAQPNFPVPIEAMRSKLNFSTIKDGNTKIIGDIDIETRIIVGEIPSLGYRVNWQNHAVVYSTANNYHQRPFNHNLIKLAQDADLLIINAPQINHKTPHDLATIWQDSVEMAQRAGVKQMIVSLHNPDYDDSYLEWMEARLRKLCPQVIFAREGMIFQVN